MSIALKEILMGVIEDICFLLTSVHNMQIYVLYKLLIAKFDDLQI